MVAIVTGNGRGLERTSAWVLGSLGLPGQVGNASFNRFGENVYVNGFNGNLIVSRTDEILLGKGPDDILTRTYNSQGTGAYNQFGSYNASGDTGDNWQLNASRRVTSYTGNGNHTSGTITLHGWDGSDTLFTWNASESAYVSMEGAGAYDTLTFNSGNNEWTWTDGNTRMADVFNDVNTNGGLLKKSVDIDGNKLTYTYDTNNRLTQVKTDNLETTDLEWDATTGTLTRITTNLSGGTVVKRVSYTYDTSNRLKTVVTDLTIGDTQDSSSVTTQYFYVTGTDRVSKIEQTGGARLEIDYDNTSAHRVTKLTQTTAAGVTRITDIDYETQGTETVTTITDSLDQETILRSDAKGQLIEVTMPEAQNGAERQVITFEYDENTGDVTSATDASGNTTKFRYDDHGNLKTRLDQYGNTITRTFDSVTNAVLTETRYLTPDPDHNPSNGSPNAPTDPLTAHYVYDAENHLVFVVSAEGHVTQHEYNGNGTRKATIHFRDNTYDRTIYTVNEVTDWIDDVADLSTVARTNYAYDARGNLTTATSFSLANSGNGSGLTNEPDTVVTYNYDQFGNLLSRQTSGVTNSEEFLYDGLGRLTASTALNGEDTTFVFDDAANRTTVTLASGYVTVSVHNLAGELITLIKGGTSETSDPKVQYKYDGAGRLRMVTDTLGNTTHYLYDGTGRKVAVVSADRSIVEYGYDDSNRLVKTIGYASKITQTQLNSLTSSGEPTDVALSTIRPSQSTNPSNSDRWEWRIYDTADRLTKVVDGDGGLTVFVYDGASNLTSTTAYFDKLDTVAGNYRTTTPTDVTPPTTNPSKNNVTQNFYDGDGRLIGTIDGDGYLNQIIYNNAGQKIEAVSFSNKPTVTTGDFEADIVDSVETDASHDLHARWFYDGRGFLRFALDAKLRPTEYVYDDAGHVLQTIEYKNSISSASSYDLGYLEDQTTAGEFATGSDRTSWSAYDAATGFRTYSVDAEGGVTHFRYNKLGQVDRVRSYKEACTTPSSDIAAMTSWVTANNSGLDRKSYMTYDAAGRLTFTIDAEGYVTEREYDTEDRVLSESRYAVAVSIADSDDTVSEVAALISALNPDPDFIEIRYEYDALGRVADSFDGEGVRTRITYDAVGRVEARQLGTGSDARETRYVYDNASRVKTETRGYGATEAAITAYAYDGMGRISDITYGSGNDYETTTHYDYDSIGQVTVETVAHGTADAAATKFSYDAFGKVVDRIAGYHATDHSEESKTHYEYDNLGRVTSETRAHGSSESSKTKYVYNAFGNIADRIAAHSTADESTTHYTYDDLGRVKTETRGHATSDASTATYNYDAFGNLTSVIDGRNNTTNYAYYKRGLVKSVTDPLGKTTDYTYDAFGNRLTATYPVIATSTTIRPIEYSFYDKLNRLTLHIDRELYATETNYTIGSEIASVKRYAAQVTETITPGIRPSSLPTTSGEDATTTFAHDRLGRLTAVTDAESKTEQYGLDDLGQRTTVTNKVNGVTTNTYNKRGLLTSESIAITWTDLSSTSQSATVVNTFTYDRRGNRKTTVEWSNAQSPSTPRTTSYIYDKLDRVTEVAHDAVTIVNPTTLTNVSGTSVPKEKFTYDKRGNLIKSEDAAGALTYFYFDDLDRRKAQVNALGTLSEWTYDDNGNVETVRVYGTPITLPPDNPPSGSGESRLTTYAYDANNRRTTTTVTSLWAGEVNGSGDYVATSGTVTITNTYDNLGNVIRQKDGRDNYVSFYYDMLNRRTAQVDQANYLTTYELDADGNIKKEIRFATVLGGTVETGTKPPGTDDTTNDRITTFEYDRNGRRTKETRKNVVAYTVDEDGISNNGLNGSLDVAATNAIIEYTYNGLGEVLTKKEATTDTTTYVYDSAGRQIRIHGQSFADFNGTTVYPIIEQSYDGLNNLTQTVVHDTDVDTDASDRVTTYTYSAGGRLATMTDAEGFVRTYGYDIAGRVLKESYTRKNSANQNIDEANATQYDALGRMIYQTVATKNGSTWERNVDQIHIDYNAYGEVSRRGANYDNETGNRLWQETFAYDTGGRMWKSTAGDGTTRLYIYDKNGAQTLTIASSGAAPAGYDWASIGIADAVDLLTNDGASGVDIGEHAVTGMVVSITVNDKRGQSIEMREPLRKLDDTSATYSLIRRREYNAFGEVKAEIDPRTDTPGTPTNVAWRTDYTYNTVGKLIQRESPRVDWTGEDGVSHTGTNGARPTERYYYDLSGRLVGRQDANAVQGSAGDVSHHTNTRTSLAGTGYGGEESKVLKEYHADGGIYQRKYDVFSDLRKQVNEVGRTETLTYDEMGRLVDLEHETRTAGSPGNPGTSSVKLIDSYAYDGLGRRTKHWNNEYTSSYKETTDYDAQGRVTKTVDMEGHATEYGYTWDDDFATTGLGTFGGWTKTTTSAAIVSGTTHRTMDETTDYFGRLIDKQDFGAGAAQHDYDFTYDLAGRLSTRAIADGVGSGDDDTTTFTYYNTGLAASVVTSYDTSNAESTISTTYTYDLAGNRTSEHYEVEGWYYVWGVDGEGNPDPQLVTYDFVHEDATVTWDALNRMTGYTDTAVANKTVIVNWKYDLNGNIRHMYNKYWELDAQGAFVSNYSERNYWYKYDSMNRFTLTKGYLDGTTIVRGTEGMDIEYDEAGRRRVMKKTNLIVGIPPQWQEQKEFYTYSHDGYLAQVDIAYGTATTNPNSIPAAGSTGTKRAEYARDRMGRVTTYTEYDTSGTNDVYKRESTYNKASQLTHDVVTTERTDGTWVATTDYHYTADADDDDVYDEAGVDLYQGGVVTHSKTTTTKDGSNQPTSEAWNGFAWWNNPLQSMTIYDPNISQTGYNTSTFHYDPSGHLQSIDIQDGRPRTVSLITDSFGQVLVRDEEDALSTGDPKELHYYFSGMAIGDVGNNGTSNVDYAASIMAHTKVPGTGPFRGGDAYGSHLNHADFDQAYDPINGLTYQGTASRYTVNEGDTLQTIAYAVWGDSSFWYMIADANGLNGSETLVAGTELIIPNKVHNAHNTSDVYRVYDPNEAIGDTSPTAPRMPKNRDTHCGVFGQILLVVIAVAVTVITGNPVVGNLASQAVGLITGIQRRFDWKGLAMAAITAEVSSGLNALAQLESVASVLPDLGSVGNAMAHAVAVNAVSQGIGVATGLQRKFDWTGVAAAGVTAGVAKFASNKLSDIGFELNISSDTKVNENATLFAHRIVAGMAGAIAGATTRTLIAGTDFGDNIIAVLPDVIGNTVGSALGEYVVENYYGHEDGTASDGEATTVRYAYSADERAAFRGEYTGFDFFDGPIGAGTRPATQEKGFFEWLWDGVVDTVEMIVSPVTYAIRVRATQEAAGASTPGEEQVVVTGHDDWLDRLWNGYWSFGKAYYRTLYNHAVGGIQATAQFYWNAGSQAVGDPVGFVTSTFSQAGAHASWAWNVATGDGLNGIFNDGLLGAARLNTQYRTAQANGTEAAFWGEKTADVAFLAGGALLLRGRAAGGLLSAVPESRIAGSAVVDFSKVSELVPGYYRANPSQLRFSQSTASPNFGGGGTIDNLITDLNNGLSPDLVRGGPLQIVMNDGIPFSMDHRRLIAFNAARTDNIPIEVVSLDDPAIALRFADRFDPIAGEGRLIVVVPNSGRTAAEQLLYDNQLIRRAP